MTLILLIASGMVLTSALLGGTALTLASDRRPRRRARRVASMHGRGRIRTLLPAPSKSSTSLILNQRDAGADTKLSELLPGAIKLRDDLARTGRSTSLKTYMAWTIATTAVVFLLLICILHYGPIVSLVIAGVAGYFLPLLVVRRMGKRRLAAFNSQFPDAIDLIVRALRAGLPLSEALVTISQECADPVGAEFRKVVGALAISRPIEEALWEIERSIDSAELRFFIISVAIQIQTGGNLGETLSNLSTILRQRSRMRMKVKAMTGEARASAAVLGSLPFVVGVLMAFTNPGYIAPLFTDPRGWVLLAGGAIMLTIGIGIMAKLVSFEI